MENIKYYNLMKELEKGKDINLPFQIFKILLEEQIVNMDDNGAVGLTDKGFDSNMDDIIEILTKHDIEVID